MSLSHAIQRGCRSLAALRACFSYCRGPAPATVRMLLSAGLFLSASCAHVPAQAAIASSSIGEHRTAVVLVNFADNAVQPITPSQANQLVLGDVNDFFWEASYQQMFLSGATFGWYTLPIASTTCDSAAIATEGSRAVAAAGVDLSPYEFVVYLFPQNSCSWGGTGSSSATGQQQVFVNGQVAFTTKLIAHEMGHRFGLQHSDAWDCDTGAIGNTCVLRGYGDPADTMGGYGAHFDAFQKERLGWFAAAGAPTITTVTASGRYVIKPYETKVAEAKALKILKSVDPNTGQKTWYYLEYRQPIGFDAGLADFGNLASGVQVRTGTTTSGGIGTSLLLDMTASSNTLVSYDIQDGALAVGRSYTDAAAGVTFTVVAADAGGATIDVTVATAPAACARATPSLSIVGPGTPLAAGATATYTISLGNRDSSACAATSFALARSVPAAWSGTLAASSLTLGPGSTASTTLTVTSSTTATGGDYGVGVGASSTVGSVHAANASTTYTIAATTGALTEAIGTDKANYLRGDSVAMSALVRNNGAPLAGATIKFTVTLPNGSATVLNASSGSDGYARASLKLGKTKAAVGSYGVRADASSGGATATASTSFSVR